MIKALVIWMTGKESESSKSPWNKKSRKSKVVDYTKQALSPKNH